MELRAVTWNLFHGRDDPPEPGLHTLRSRLLGRPERGVTHVQVNRELLEEFTAVLRDTEWDAALLQECPPRWAGPLASACGARAHRSLTSRNRIGWLRAAMARRNPDLVGAWEGGSNLTLLRGSLGGGEPARETRVLRRRPERRTVALTRTAGGLAIANLHASTGQRSVADVLRAAEHAVEWAAGSPLLFGGDMNWRPEQGGLYERLASEFGLRGITARDAIDHLLVRDLEVVEPAAALPGGARELAEDGLLLRLSDHAPVAGRFRQPD